MKAIDEIRQKLSTDRKWTERAIVVLYNRQTEDEKEYTVTFRANNVGFNSFDAKKLTRFAVHIIGGGHLSDRELHDAQQVVPKYAKQILSIIKQKS